MSVFLTLAFLFFIGSVIGWVIELFFRRFFSVTNPERRWINPGFCTGPYLPLYGVGLCILYLIASAEQYNWIENPLSNKLALFAAMAIFMTGIEYIAGVLALKVAKVRLWDYRGEWGNIQGIICPRFSLIWAALGALYYFLIHPYILNALTWLSQNLAFSFVVGMFFGVFIIDAAHSIQLITRLRQFADEYEIVVRYETLKAHIRSRADATRHKYQFFRPFHSDRPLREHVLELKESFESLKKR